MKINMGLGLQDSALAINYLTHTLWAWIAFLTTTTAALSLWTKFKSANYYLHNSHRHHPLRLSHESPPPQPQTSSDEPADQQQPLPPPQPAAASATSCSSLISSTFCWLENRKSGKFKVYYCGGRQVDELMDDAKDDVDHNDDDDIVVNNIIATVPVVVVVGRGGGRSHIHDLQQQQQEGRLTRKRSKSRNNVAGAADGGWEYYWEAVLKVKRGEMDWYRHQDLRVLDGNVVRLWN